MMRKSTLLVLAAGAATTSPGYGATLQQALEAAYQSNPTVSAARANARAADENVPIARAGGLPRVEVSADFQEYLLQGDSVTNSLFSDPDRQITGQVNGTLPLITFGAVSGAVRAAESRVSASQMGLRSTEAELFTSVVGVYMDVLRDEATVQLNRHNREVMEFTLGETRARERAGNRGPTDSAQAEARVALAQAQLETAEARLIGSREEYVRLVGSAPGQLEPPPPLPSLPATPEEAVSIALGGNPKLASAKALRLAAEHDITVARAEGLPRVNAIAGVNYYNYLGSLAAGTGPRNRDQGTTAQAGVQLKIPLFQGGRVAAQTRQAIERYGAAADQVAEAERKVVADTRSSLATFVAAQRVVAAAERGVAANTRALIGLRAETQAGLRPLLDRLNAEQELLNAQVTLVTARRDAYVAGFALLAAIGRAEAASLNFSSNLLYDPQVHYREVRRKIFGAGTSSQPSGTGTSASSAQDATIATPPTGH